MLGTLANIMVNTRAKHLQVKPYPNSHRPPVLPASFGRVRRSDGMHKIVCPANIVRNKRGHEEQNTSEPCTANAPKCNAPKHQQAIGCGFDVSELAMVGRRLINTKQATQGIIPRGIEIINRCKLPQIAAATKEWKRVRVVRMICK